MTDFLSILSQIGFHLVQNRKKNCHHDEIPFNFKGNLFFGEYIINIERNSLSFGVIILKAKLKLRQLIVKYLIKLKGKL